MKAVQRSFVLIMLLTVGTLTYAADQPGKFVPTRTKAQDSKLSIDFELLFLKHPSDSGVYGLVIRAHNQSQKDLVFPIPNNLNDAFTVRIADHTNRLLSVEINPEICFHKEQHKRVDTLIPKNTRKEWHIKIVDRLKNGNFPEDRLEGCRIFVGIIYPGSSTTLYDTDVILTRKALLDHDKK